MCKAPKAQCVGVPGPGERVCGRCRGHGQLNKPTTKYPGYELCNTCEGSGVRPIRKVEK